MGTAKRERQKQGRQVRLEQAMAEQQRKQRWRSVRNVILIVVAIVVALLVTSRVFGGDDSKTPVATSSAASTGSESSASDATAVTTPGGFAYGTFPCPNADGSSPRTIDFSSAPQQCIDPAKTYVAAFATTAGVVKVTLDTKTTPGTTNNFVVLSRYHYYDGTKIFRAASEIGIIQGGSPHNDTNTDQGPGYDLPDEGFDYASLPGAASGQPTGGPYSYGAGDLVMARSGQANGAGAQFFFGATDAINNLNSQGVYVKFGATTEGQDVLKAILDSAGGDAVPKPEVTINTVTITET